MCDRGSTQEVILEGKSISIDACIAAQVEFLSKKGVFQPLGSCCGHGMYPRTIIVREIATDRILEYYTLTPIPRKRNFYKTDPKGKYFLPEVHTIKTNPLCDYCENKRLWKNYWSQTFSCRYVCEHGLRLYDDIHEEDLYDPEDDDEYIVDGHFCDECGDEPCIVLGNGLDEFHIECKRQNWRKVKGVFTEL